MFNPILARALRWLCLAVLAAPALQAHAADQSCIDEVAIACFDETCADPYQFQECIIGCATGGNGSRQICRDQCFYGGQCLDRCVATAAGVQTCHGATQKVTVVRGTPTLNRSTGQWQQSLRFTNNTPLETLHNVAVVLDALDAGWTLTNPDGTTVTLVPGNVPYKEVATKLLPGQAVTLVLRFARTGTPALSYTPVVYNVPNR